MSKKKEALEQRLKRLEETLSKEEERLRKVINNIGWGNWNAMYEMYAILPSRR